MDEDMQLLQQQLESAHQQIEQLDEKAQEAQALKKALEELKTVKEGSDVLIPVTNGVFAEGKITGTKSLKVNVGNGVVVSKSLDDTMKIIDRQIIEIKKLQESTQNDFNNMMAQLQQSLKTDS